jgi:hypothetical protein
MIYGQSLSVATYFRENVNTGLVLDEEMDYSEYCAKYRKEIAAIHELCLLAQIGLAHILRADNREKFRRGV